MLYYQRSSFSWLELMRAKIDELWPQTCVAVAFLYTILCVTTRTTRKVKVVWRRFTYQMIALLSKIPIVWVRAVCVILSASYGFKHASQPLSDMTFCAYLHSQLENYRSYADVLHIEWLFYYHRCLFSVLELDVRYEWRVTPPSMHRSLFTISHFCVYIQCT